MASGMHAVGASFSRVRLAASSRALFGEPSRFFSGASSERVSFCRGLHKTVFARYTSASKATARARLSPENGGERKVYVNHTFYKGKCALAMRPLKPTFRLIENGGAALEREGCIFLEFALSTGVRQYDWNNKSVFALSVGEIGQLICLGPNDSCEFFHDPGMKSDQEGLVRKSLRIQPMADKNGFFFNLTVASKSESSEDRYNMAISKAEYFVMRTAFTYTLPVLMGWHAVVDPSLVEELMNSPTPEGMVTDGAKEWAK